MDKAVRDVCNELGVAYLLSKPRLELYQLFLQETGSQ